MLPTLLCLRWRCLDSSRASRSLFCTVQKDTVNMSHWGKIRPLIPPLWQRFGNQVTIDIVAMVASFLVLFTVPLISKSALDRLSTSQNDPFFALLERQLTSLGLPDDLVIYGQLALSGALIVIATAIAGYFVYLRGRSIALAAEGMSRHLRDHSWTTSITCP